MRTFRGALNDTGLATTKSRPLKSRRWIYVPYDQLTLALGPLAREDREELGVVLVESVAKAKRRPYHKQKLALVLANMRHFAVECAAKGIAVRYEATAGGYADVLAALTKELGTIRVMEPAERELREELAPLFESGALECIEHEGWLTTAEQFERAAPNGPPWRMDRFYKIVRNDTGILMDDDKPVGGKYSHDADNRNPWKGKPAAPDLPSFRPDAITKEVGALVEEKFADHPGKLDLSSLPANHRDALRMWRWARESCMEHFGPYEDAMSTASRNLFHTRVSHLINVHRLLPKQVVDDVLALDIPLASKEGFVRQVIGWREFVRHVHVATDGFRSLDGRTVPVNGAGDATPSFLRGRTELPAAFWDTKSGLRCLDTVVESVWDEAYSHHITRLMILSNLGTLLDLTPRALTDWFWVAYHDAYDWVVEPNVLGMGLFAAGDIMTTKPYVSGAAYIDRMSDYCGECTFHPKKNCPITRLYWAFLARKEKLLSGNHRVGQAMASLRKRSAEKKKEDARVFETVRARLAKGEPVTPEDLD
ncbi:MAG: deoxyribodipyrimidine photolyase [Gemmatimonadetes bacterium]|nr:deoxyribodipyrimidine photolyase [Gemmatimonadota bacterium]